jgi:transposase
MPIVASDRPTNTVRASFTPVPWHDQHPTKLDIEQRLAPDHLAFRIEAAVARLDLLPLRACYGPTGSDPFPPELLLRAVLFETQRGQHSPAVWHRDATENDAVRWLLRGLCPSRTCWYTFRDRIAPVLQQLNSQPLTMAQAATLTAAERGSLDGTSVAANASRHQLVNEATLQTRAALLDAAVAADGDDVATRPPAPGTASTAERSPAAPVEPAPVAPADAAVRATAGAAATPPAWMARTRSGRRQQQKRMHQARQRMAALQARNGAKRADKRTAAERIVVSLGDPEAVAGYDKEDIYRPLYNVQILDDLDSPFVLAYEVFAQPNDAGLMATMLTRVEQMAGRRLQTLLVDTAYTGGADLAAATAAEVVVYAPLAAEGENAKKQLPKSVFVWEASSQAYVCPAGHRLEYERSVQQKRSGPEAVRLDRYRCDPSHCSGCPLRERCTPNPEAGRTISRSEYEEEIEALRGRMATAEAKDLYRRRSQSVELVNADWKQHRKLRRFSGRGLARARCQVGLVVLAHNVLTLLSEEKKAKAAKAAVVNPTGNVP